MKQMLVSGGLSRDKESANDLLILMREMDMNKRYNLSCITRGDITMLLGNAV